MVWLCWQSAAKPSRPSEFPVPWEKRGIFAEFDVSAPDKWPNARQSPRQFPNEQNREFALSNSEFDLAKTIGQGMDSATGLRRAVVCCVEESLPDFLEPQTRSPIPESMRSSRSPAGTTVLIRSTPRPDCP